MNGVHGFMRLPTHHQILKPSEKTANTHLQQV
jgi:hypothetical protein